MKTIRCNLAKTCRIIAIFTESFHKNMGILLQKIQEISPVYLRNIRLSILLLYVRSDELLVYKGHPHSKGYKSISILYFSLGQCQFKGDRNVYIYVPKVMKIFEHPSYFLSYHKTN